MEGSKPDRTFTSYVTGNYFEVLGVEPLMGRFFHAGEGETPGADPVMVLSYAYWQQHFGGDMGIIGRQVMVDNHPVTIVGVAPREFRGMNPALSPQAYLPLAMVVPLESETLADFHKQSNRNLWMYGRLQPGVTRQQADATLALIAHRFVTADPSTEKDAEVKTFASTAGRTGFDPDNHLGTVAMLFLALAGLVLLLASVNVANLLLVRATVREREMVIRSALGAQRFRLIRQMMTESFVLALLGGAAGIGLGMWGSHLLGTVNLNTDLPISFDFPNDWHVFAFSAVVALAAGALVGIVPAVRLARANLNLVLREGGRGVAGGGHKFRDALVIVQVGSALTLLIVAGLFIRSLQQSEHAELGFNPANVLTMMMDPGRAGVQRSAVAGIFPGSDAESARAAGGADGDDRAVDSDGAAGKRRGHGGGEWVSAAVGAGLGVSELQRRGDGLFSDDGDWAGRGAELQRWRTTRSIHMWRS